ncbi:MAG: IS110 family transposase [Acidobacteriaceae bacterium]|nr:IS110 family transposase [Acidobacteriaceae bacterium]
MNRLIRRLWDEWQNLEEQVEELTAEITAAIKETAVGPLLLEVPGVGPLVATAMIAAVENGSAFHKGREFAAWLGLTSRQHSTGTARDQQTRKRISSALIYSRRSIRDATE